MFDPLLILLTATILFAIYGINHIGEKFRGHHLSSSAEDSLEELCNYCDHFIRYNLKIADVNRNKIRRLIKPRIVEEALNKSLEDIEARGEDSMTASWLNKEIGFVLRELKLKNR